MNLFNIILLIIFLKRETLTVKGLNDTFGKMFVFALPMNDEDIAVKLYYFNIDYEVEGYVCGLEPYGSEECSFYRQFHLVRDQIRHMQDLFNDLLPSILLAERKVTTNLTYVIGFDHEVAVTLNIFSRKRWASTQLVPVDGWGRKYFAVTLRNNPFVLVVTFEPNMARITLHASDPAKFRIQIDSSFYGHGDSIGIEMIRNSTYRLELCDHVESITGTIVEGLKAPVGVISGNCNGYAYNGAEACRDDNEMDPPHGYNVEMLLPYETFGKEFHTFGDLFGYYLIVSSQPETVVYLHQGGNKEITNVTLSTLGTQHTVRPLLPLVAVYSTKPVQVVFVKLVECSHPAHDTNHDLAITLVIPTTLFMNVYYWRNFKTTGIVHFTIVVCNEKELLFRIYLDQAKFDTYKHSFDKFPLDGWAIVKTLISQDEPDYPESKEFHVMHMDHGAKFGLYLYGISKTQLYMHPGGFILARLNPKKCHKDTMRKGDKLDNDCDERVDEEIRDDLDNDNDGRIDEDLGYPPPRDGKWGVGQCFNCSNGEPVRVRECDDPRPLHTGARCGPKPLLITHNDEECNRQCELYKKKEWVFTPTTALSEPFFSPENFKYTLKEVTDVTTISTESTTSTTVRTNSTPTTTAATSTTAESQGRESKGIWGHWSEWECSSDCKDTRMISTRKCDDPDPSDSVEARCYGPAVMHKDSTCKSKCPEECPVGKWGLNCVQSCENCDPDCNKRNGTCQLCKPGFHYPHLSCSKACGNFTYGFMCTGDCAVKCDGKDCLEREIGVCPGPKLIPSVYWLLVLVVPISLLLVLRFRRSRLGKSPKAQGQSSRSETLMKSSLISTGSKGAVEDNVSQSSGRLRMVWQSRRAVKPAQSTDDKLMKVSEERVYQFDETYGTNV